MWRPLLEGDLAADAEAAVHAIGEALAAQSLPDSSVSSGKAGLALFFGYLAKSADADTQRHTDRAEELLDQAVEALATNPMSPDLYGGFTGIAWVAEHSSSEPGEADDDMSAAIDEGLLMALAAPWTGDYDLVRGLVGFGVYALARVPRPSAPRPSVQRCLEAIVDRLNETAERSGDGVTWFTPPALLPGHHLKQYPRGYYNLGVAHGVPGVIGLLADACRLGIRPETARPLLEGAVRWVLSQRLPEGRGACFPAWVAPGIEARPSRLAWCYGDPGVATALLYAARAVGNREWERTALDIAARAASAAPEEAGVHDAGLCHGAFGLAHLYNRIYQAGGGDSFADAARLWYRRGLDLRRPEGGIAGYEAWHLGPNMQFGWVADPGFLTGAVGIGLALLAGITSVEPEWDRLLMAAIPPTPSRGQ
jgi:hypothetical protein